MRSRQPLLTCLVLSFACALVVASTHDQYLSVLDGRASMRSVRPERNLPPLMGDWNPTPHPTDENRFIEDSVYQGEEGESVTLKYDVVLRDTVVPLDALTHVNDVVCSPEGIYIRSGDVAALMETSPGTVFGVAPGFNCQNEQDGTVHARVRQVEQLRDDVVFVGAERVGDVFSLISHGNVDFVYSPQHATTNKRFDYAGSFNLTDGLNYDPDSGSELIGWQKKFNISTVTFKAYTQQQVGIRFSAHIGITGVEFEVALFALSKAHMDQTLILLTASASGEVFNLPVLKNQYLFSFPIPISGVPIDLTLTGSLKLILNHNIRASASVSYNMDQSFDYRHNYEIGFKYSSKDNVITPIKTFESFLDNHFVGKVNLNADIRMYVVPSLKLKIQPATTAEATFSFYAGLELSLNESCPGLAAKYAVYYGLDTIWDVKAITFLGKTSPGKYTEETWIPKTYLNEKWATGCVGYVFNQSQVQQNFVIQQTALGAYYAYLFTLYNGTFFQNCDTFGKCDPFVNVAICWIPSLCTSTVFSSSVINDVNYPSWKQSFMIYGPTSATSLMFFVYDSDPFSNELLWRGNVTFPSLTSCGNAECFYKLTDPLHPTDSIIFSVNAYSPLSYTGAMRPGSWLSFHTLIIDEVYQVALATFYWAEQVTIKMRGDGGATMRLFTAMGSAPNDTFYAYTTSGVGTISITVPGPFTNSSIIYIRARPESNYVYNFSLWISPSKTFASPKFSEPITFSTLPYTYYWLKFLPRSTWDGVAIHVNAQSQLATDIAVGSGTTYTSVKSNTTFNTLFVDKSLFTGSALEFELYNHPAVSTYNISNEGSIDVVLVPVFRLTKFAQSRNITYSVENGLVYFLLSVPLPVTPGLTTIKFSKSVQSIITYRIAENAPLDDSLASQVYNSDYVTVNNSLGHVLLSIRDTRGAALGDLFVKPFPKSTVSSGASLFLPSLEYSAHYFGVSVPDLGTSTPSSRPLALVTTLFSNYDYSAVLAGSLTNAYPTSADGEWTANVIDPSQSSLYISSTASTNPGQINIGLILTTPSPTYIKVDAGYKFQVTASASFTQSLSGASLLLNILYPSAWAGAQVGCTGGGSDVAASVGYTQSIAAALSVSAGISASESIANDGSNAMWARIVKINPLTTSCSLFISPLTTPTLSISPSTVAASSIRAGPVNLTLTLTNSQYSFVSDLFDSSTTSAVAFLSSFFSSVPFQAGYWNAVVRPALLSNPASRLVRISSSQVVVQLPQVASYTPSVNEVLTFAASQDSFSPFSSAVPTASVTITY